jgi:curved DNA-binding protein CbpA
MTNLENSSIPEEENYYQTLSVTSTATLVEIRNAYEEKLEEAHLEAIAAYSLFPEEETEQHLLQLGQAFVTLANPIARAKYDDEILQQPVEAEQPANSKQESAPISETQLAEKPAWEKTETAHLPHNDKNKRTEEKIEIAKSAPKEVVGQTQVERQDFYLNLAVKNEMTEESLEEYYSRLRAHGGKVSFNGAVLKQIRELKSITLDELAKITCIRSTYLEAIEEENFKKFASEIYLKGYLICYVEAMKLPAEQIIEEYINLYKNHLETKKG